MKGVFLDFSTVSHNDVDPAPLGSALDEFDCHDATAPEDIAARVKDANVILTNKCRITRDVMEAAPDLRLVTLAATGFDNVDLDAARELNVGVTNIRAYSTPSVAQHVFALLLTLNQRLDDYRELLSSGAWKRAPNFTMLDFPIHELAGRTMGIIGYGELGHAVANIAAAFGMDVIVAERAGRDPRHGRVSFEKVIKESDVLSLHCPLNADTRHLINANILKQMKKSALLINTARGAVVDEQALADALRNGDIAGAGVDVLSQEPPVDGNPLLDGDIPNLVITPHIAWAGVEARQRAVGQMAECIREFRAGNRMNRVD
ncbi:MAG: 2-hydroxyacid dehydrogenase [Gammaproteobacteria bacterium]|nr:2-hydroxyacid dehydrogenase [Gammaproteobacteria bacterium]